MEEVITQTRTSLSSHLSGRVGSYLRHESLCDRPVLQTIFSCITLRYSINFKMDTGRFLRVFFRTKYGRAGDTFSSTPFIKLSLGMLSIVGYYNLIFDVTVDDRGVKLDFNPFRRSTNV